MDPCNLYTYNPLAPDFLNGFEDIGTPAGCVDLYSEFTYDVTLAANENRPADRISFDADFLVMLLGAWTDNNIKDPVVRLKGPDGQFRMNTRVKLGQIAGPRGAEKPWFPTLFVPLARYIEIDIENTQAAPVHVQIIFIGLRRWRVSQ